MATIYTQVPHGSTSYTGASGPGVAIGNIPRLDVLSLWLDAATASTITLNGSDVSTWTDKSEQVGHNVTQGTAAKQPAYSSSAINTNNAITFTAANSDVLANTSNAIANGSSGEVWMVLRHNQASNGAPLGSTNSADDNPGLYFAITNTLIVDGNWRIGFLPTNNAGTILSLPVCDTPLTANTTYVIRAGSTGTSYYFEVNGSAATITFALGTSDTGDWFADAGTRNQFAVGALKRTTESGFFNGVIGEIMIWNAPLITTEAAQITTYLKKKWGVA